MRILISGAGIAGPSLAWWLSKTGQKVTVVEKAAALLAHGQNVDVHGSAVQILRKMGLLEEVKRLNTTEKGTQMVNAKGQTIAAFPVEPGGQDLSPTSEYEILRGDLSKLLYENTKDLDDVEYRFDTTIKEVLSNDEKEVKVRFSDNSEESFDVLVAADGQWSAVRKMCFPPESIEIRDFGMVASYWTAPRTSADNDWWNIYIATGRRGVTIRPDPYGTIRAMLTRMPEDKTEKEKWDKVARQDKESQKALLKKEFANVGWETKRLLDSLDKAPDFYFQAVQQIKMKKWSSGRVICMGDTAHAPTPLTGMGTSLAITGPYLLAQELKKLGPEQAPSVAFDCYEKIFRPFVEDIQRVPSIVPGVVHPTSAWQRWILWTFIYSVSKFIKAVGYFNSFRSRSSQPTPRVEEVDFVLPDYGEDGGLSLEGRK